MSCNCYVRSCLKRFKVDDGGVAEWSRSSFWLFPFPWLASMRASEVLSNYLCDATGVLLTPWPTLFTIMSQWMKWQFSPSFLDINILCFETLHYGMGPMRLIMLHSLFKEWKLISRRVSTSVTTHCNIYALEALSLQMKKWAYSASVKKKMFGGLSCFFSVYLIETVCLFFDRFKWNNKERKWLINVNHAPGM